MMQRLVANLEAQLASLKKEGNNFGRIALGTGSAIKVMAILPTNPFNCRKHTG